ncbi:14285_t:CDS:2, partial [Gigaspora margarita]
NVLEGIPFEDNTFDFVFQRYLVFGYPKEKWPFIMNEIVRVLKLGGFLEAITNIISLYESLKPSLMEHLQISDTKLSKLIKNSEKELFDFDSFYYM